MKVQVTMLGEGAVLAIKYNKLWKLMIDRNMNKTQLRNEAGLSTNVIARLSRNDSVSMETLTRICAVFHCDVGDIMELVPDAPFEQAQKVR